MKNLYALRVILVVSIFLVCPVSMAWAYVGPGMGITMIGGFWTVIVIILSAATGMLVWPIRAFLRWKRGRSVRSDADDGK